MKPTEIIINSIKTLLCVCDGANTIDGKGFNKIDSRFAHSLVTCQNMSNKQYKASLMMLAKYRKQLEGFNITLPSMYDLDKELKMTKIVMSAKIEKRILDLSDAGVIVDFEYNSEIKNTMDSIIPFGKWNPDNKTWLFRIEQLDEIMEKLIPYGFTASDNLKQKLEEMKFDKELMQQSIDDRKDWCINWLDMFCPSEYKLFDHQWLGVDFLLSDIDTKAILGHDTGLGKTLSAIATTKSLVEYYKSELSANIKVIVICPVSLKIMWLRYAEKFKLKIEVYSYRSIPQPPASTNYIVIGDEIHHCQNIKATMTKKMIALTSDQNCIGFLDRKSVV
jgi:SNF2 family DNA or RNA helicase